MLKADLHLHSKEDAMDPHITYSAKDLIDRAAQLNFNMLAFTFHNQLFWKEELITYAEKKGIMLIPGSEMIIEGKDVLVYNLTKQTFNDITSFEDLKRAKEKDRNIFVIAPHPYFPGNRSLGKALEKHINLFDAIEYSWFHSSLINFNQKAVRIAKKHNKPLIATSDCHHLPLFGKNYIIANSSHPRRIGTVIRKGRCKNTIAPLSTIKLIYHGVRIIYKSFTTRRQKAKSINTAKI